ncbi:hypothetical protein [Streptomyces sp. NPDC056785]|uniref:hypothetical protein n=1 Tax=Streptomyces sp. NPDC056785 TaxID=3345944 RepID=UPI0036B6113B
MVNLFAFFGPPVITLALFVTGTLPYALWVKWRNPSRAARWAVLGGAAAIAAYGAATVYGLAFTDPLDLCGTRTGDGVYMDAGRDYSLTSADVGGFPPSATCHWTSGHSSDVGWFWTAPLLYAGIACAVVCCALLVNARVKHARTRRRARPGMQAGPARR